MNACTLYGLQEEYTAAFYTGDKSTWDVSDFSWDPNQLCLSGGMISESAPCQQGMQKALKGVNPGMFVSEFICTPCMYVFCFWPKNSCFSHPSSHNVVVTFPILRMFQVDVAPSVVLLIGLLVAHLT